MATVYATISGTSGTASVPVTFTVNDAQITLGNGDKLYLFNSADFRNSAGVGSYNYGIFGARITAAGIASQPVPLATWPNSDTGYNYVAGLQHGGVKFAPLPSGGFVLVWEIDQWSGRSLGVFARFFDSNGDPTTGQIPAGYDPDQTQSWAGGGPNNPIANSDTSVSTSFLKGIYPNNFNNAATVDLANVGFTVSAASTAEGSTAVFTFRVPITAAGVTLPYSISGIQSSDSTAPLTGTVTVGSDGRATISVPLVIDSSTENETATVTLMGFNSSTIVVDSTSGSGNSSSNPICFALGTQIKTAQGPALVESLNSDATVIDFNGKNANVKWIGRQRRTPEGLALLKERSPLYKASQIVRPLLIGQGANDPRVNQAESDQIVQAMQSKGIPVTYVLFPDEGHGFAKPENNIAFNAMTESFLSSCLGGRLEPIGDTVKRSSAKIPVGAQHTPGLGAALK